jgi:Flp pilus assembly protein TadG
MPRLSFRRFRREDGQAQVEFALSIMVVLFVVFCAWELLMAMYTASVMADAAKEGVRYAIVHGSNSTLCSGPNTSSPCANDPSGDQVKDVVKAYAKASLHDTSAISVTVSYPDGTNEAPSRVTVDVTYQYVPYIKLGFFTPSLTTKAAGRIVN